MYHFSRHDDLNSGVIVVQKTNIRLVTLHRFSKKSPTLASKSSSPAQVSVTSPCITSTVSTSPSSKFSPNSIFVVFVE